MLPPDKAGHYLDEFDGPRFWAHVDPHGGQDYLADPLARLETDAGECWNWNGRPSTDHYGRFRIFGGWQQAHRIAYLDFGLVLPADSKGDHLCRNHGCVRPSHLEPVSQQENVARGINGNISHCPAGHEYTEENTVIRSVRGRRTRYCRVCLRASKRRTYERSRAAA